MALMSCPECAHKVSSLAKACPQCACPLGDNVVTIQKTAKNYKAQKFIGIVGLLICGIFLSVLNTMRGVPEFVTAILVIGCLVFFMILLSARIGAWWDHG